MGMVPLPGQWQEALLFGSGLELWKTSVIIYWGSLAFWCVWAWGPEPGSGDERGSVLPKEQGKEISNPRSNKQLDTVSFILFVEM